MSAPARLDRWNRRAVNRAYALAHGLPEDGVGTLRLLPEWTNDRKRTAAMLGAETGPHAMISMRRTGGAFAVAVVTMGTTTPHTSPTHFFRPDATITTWKRVLSKLAREALATLYEPKTLAQVFAAEDRAARRSKVP